MIKPDPGLPIGMSAQRILLTFCLFFLYSACFAQEDLQKGLLACYPFSGNANDARGNGNHGTVHGAVLATDRFGNANSTYRFDGVDDYIGIPPDQFKNSTYSFSLWMKVIAHPTKGNDYKLFSIGSANGSQQIALSNFYLGKHFGWVATSYSADPPGTSVDCANTYLPGLHTWYHIVSARDDSTLKLYINGELVQSADTKGAIPFYGENPEAMIGAGSIPTPYTTTDIDDIRIYNRALSANEVALLYNAPNLSPGSIAIHSNEPRICPRIPVTFTASPVIPGVAYQWKVDGVAQDQPDNSATFTYAFPDKLSDYASVVEVEVSSTAGCSSVVAQTTIKVQLPIKPVVSIVTSEPFTCPGTPATFTAVPTVPGATYEWKVDGVTQGQPGTSAIYSYTFPDKSSTYTAKVEVDVTAADKCTLPASAQLTVNVTPLLSILVKLTVDSQVSCAGKPVTFAVSPTMAGSQYQWKINGANQGGLTDSPTFVHTFPDENQAYEAVISVDVFAKLKCTAMATDQIKVQVLPNPKLTCSFTSTVDKGVLTQHQVIANQGRPPYTYSWKFGNDERTTSSDTLSYAFADTGRYEIEVIARDQSGCKAVCQSVQQVVQPLFFPNVFTPNGDTHNDTFTIQYGGNDFEMRIYNRWGYLVAKTADGLNGWDGKGCPTGLYYYQITLASKEYKGWLSLLR